MAADWTDRIRRIASDLLTLEVNVAVRPGMTAQKMPELPIALHLVVESYADALREVRRPVTLDLLRAAAAHLGPPEAKAGITIPKLERWFADDWRPDRWRNDNPAADLTNGAETFEAMQWAAFAALAMDLSPPKQALIRRVRENSRQLRAAAIVLEKQFSSGDPQAGVARTPAEQQSVEPNAPPYEKRLSMIAGGDFDVDMTKEPRRLFGGTMEQTASALFKHPRPVLNVAPDLTILVRKAWDVGLEDVVFQTVLQLDGDVLLRFSDEIDTGEREFFRLLQHEAVREGVGQWKLLFQTVAELIGETGTLLFGSSKGR